LRIGWLIDGTGGPIQKEMLLKIEQGKIRTLRSYASGDDQIPGVIDWSQYTILPGLIDSHVHLFMSGTSDADIRQNQLKADYSQSKTVIAKHLAQHLACGVVAVRDGGDRKAHVLRYKNQEIQQIGIPVSLRTAGSAWRQAGRYGKLIGHAPKRFSSLAEAIRQTTDQIDHVKIVNSGLNSLTVFGKETAPQFALSEMKEAVKVGRSKGLPTMVHANGRLPVKIAVEAGCVSIEHGFFMGRENLQRMVENRTFWVPTGFTMQGYANQLPSGTLEAKTAQHNLEDQLQQLMWARERGVCIALGTDAGSLGVHHGAAVLEELRLFSQAGYSVQEAIQCATSNGSALLGLHNFGTLAQGMSATLVAVAGDPSRLPGSLSKVEHLIVGGCKIKPTQI